MRQLKARYEVGMPLVVFGYQGTVIGRVWGPEKNWQPEWYYLVRFTKFIAPHWVRESEFGAEEQ